jgi:hypothetical protein
MYHDFLWSPATMMPEPPRKRESLGQLQVASLLEVTTIELQVFRPFCFFVDISSGEAAFLHQMITQLTTSRLC